MRTRRLLFIAVAISGVAGVSVALRPSRPPTLDCPGAVSCDSVEVGQTATARFELANAGDQELHVTDLRSSCGCAGLEYEEDGRFVRPSELRVGPRTFARLAIRVAAGSVTSGPVTQAVHFRTNDPSRPEHTITATIPVVVAGLRSQPRAVLFGAVAVNERPVRTVEVIDGRKPPRPVVSAMTQTNGPFVARILDTQDGRTLVEVSFQPPTPGRYEDVLELRTDTDSTRAPLRVELTGRATALIELSPPTLVLPIASDDGHQYRGAVLCRLAGSVTPTDLSPGLLPTGLTVEVGPLGPSTRLVVTWNPKAVPPAGRLTVPVTVSAGGTTHRVELEVHVLPRP